MRSLARAVSAVLAEVSGGPVVVAALALEEVAALALEEVAASALEEVAALALEEVAASALEEVVALALEEVVASALEEAVLVSAVAASDPDADAVWRLNDAPAPATALHKLLHFFISADLCAI
ncbi:uncharacterized protein LOC126481198 isoform X1 [Schistocerca serialis cubense]|uniref:uncharacterized protein LOC126481198 isoform X1 n=1 Tax=Schistocerca serialis cubense TaxID=2023355 RepID=UPI00214E1170|nr:uncharacterized protein LOC126481198 isoform X1 [Schistocerca serialis cubense]